MNSAGCLAHEKRGDDNDEQPRLRFRIWRGADSVQRSAEGYYLARLLSGRVVVKKKDDYHYVNLVQNFKPVGSGRLLTTAGCLQASPDTGLDAGRTGRRNTLVSQRFA